MNPLKPLPCLFVLAICFAVVAAVAAHSGAAPVLYLVYGLLFGFAAAGLLVWHAWRLFEGEA